MDISATSPARLSTSVRRRSLLLGIGTVALAVGSGAGLALDTADDARWPPAAFLAVSRFVTGAKLDDPAATARAWTQLTTLDRGFAAAVDRLHSAVETAKVASMDAFLASPLASDPRLIATARTITSAWYLGYTGTPVTHRMKDDTGFVTFIGALMWRPTIDATVIPTFARAGTDYWIDPPAGTPTAPAPRRERAWQGSASAPHQVKA